MDYKNAIEPVTRLKTRSAELIGKVKETKQPIIITQNGNATAVLQDIDSFQRQRETLLLMRFVLQGVQDYRQGRTLSHAEVKQHFKDRFAGFEDID